jgi:hypothetical protein
MKKIKFNIPLSLNLFLIGALFIVITVYLDYQIIDRLGQTTVLNPTTKSIELNQDLYQKILAHNTNNTTSISEGSIGRADPFSPVQ